MLNEAQQNEESLILKVGFLISWNDNILVQIKRKNGANHRYTSNGIKRTNYREP